MTVPNKNYDNLFIISSPSGGGKGTLISKLLETLPNLWLSVSATSREPRVGEEDGVNYYFLTKEEFLAKIKEGDFLEWAQYSENFYGTPKTSIDEHLEKGEKVILEIEVQGALEVMEKCPGCHSIFIKPPSMEVLEERLRGRQTDSEEQIKKRLSAAKDEIKEADNYEKIIINDDLDLAFSQLKEYIISF